VGATDRGGGAPLASAIEALHVGSTNLDRAFYGTDNRVYQLLAGAFLALTPQLLRLAPAARRVIGALAMPSLLALVVFATSPMFGWSTWIKSCARGSHAATRSCAT
jgi:peptidoglycan/LPS O-acetylase OafA/YrhL